ncbi:hypothetical protein BYT27DRAFT_7260604 [Phlegmacium glaucopus]|nr:hypothetical protein BYT27DRAFT_7260604 [Phlegmacium glaucopus]
MTRQLRPREGRPSYAALAGYEMDKDSDAGAGPSSAPFEAVMENDSEGDFIPAKNNHSKDANVDVDSEGHEALGPDPEPPGNEVQDARYDMEEVDIFEPDEISGKPENVVHRIATSTSTPSRTKRPTAKDKGKGKAKGESAEVTTVSQVRRPKGKMYALPTPSVHHRHRAVPLYSRAGRTERLTARPSLFEPPSLTMTTSFTERPKVSERVNKAWGFNVGYGPLWDLAEDRGWYKEAITTGSNIDTEAKRRPRVYPDIRVQKGWEVMSLEAASPYLPTDDITTEEGDLRPPPPVSCFFGPFKSQIPQDVKMFEAFPMSKYTLGSKAHIFNAGAPVWGMDWCPIHVLDRPARSYKQYLAVAPFPSHSHSPDIGRKVKRPSYSCIQIWSLSPAQRNVSKKKSEAPDLGQMKCEMVLCLDSGPAYDLRWCPLPSHDLKNDTRQPKKLGLLGGTFEDGSFAIYAVPDPSDIISSEHDQSYPICDCRIRFSVLN